MLVKFFARGKGEGRGPVEYITRKNYPGTNKLRYPAPQVIRGNPTITRRLIDSLEFKHKYNSGVLSFAPSDATTEKEIEAVIDSFERYAFAGLDKDAYNTLWVKHTHTGNERVELHFVTPRVELYTGKSLNIAPPGWHGYFKPWQTSLNIKQGWARPDDPARKRDYEPGFQALINADRKAKGNEPLADTRKLLTEYVLARVTAGLISDRDGIINLFTEELGLKIARQGKSYITVLDPKTEERYRLKGKLYEREFRPQPEIAAEARSGTTTSSRTNAKELLEVTERIKSNYQSRAKYHRERYKVPKLNSDKDLGQILPNTRSSGVEPLSGYLRGQLGDDAILIESDNQETGDVRLSGRENQFHPSGVKFATTDSEVNPVGDSRNSDYSNGQRNISDSPDELNPDGWLEMPGKTLSETGALKDTATHIDNERTRKQINDRFREVGESVQTGHEQFVSQIQFGYESARGAEQTATLSSNELERSSHQLKRANREAERQLQQINGDLSRVRVALKKKRAKQLERFKTEINLVNYATSIGYEYQTLESSPNSAVLRHKSGDKIVVVTDTENRGIYLNLSDDGDRGTIIDFIQHRRNFSLGEVRLELRPWLVKSDRYRSIVENVAKPKPMGRDRINEYLQRLKNLSQTKPQQSQQKPKRRQQSQLEP